MNIFRLAGASFVLSTAALIGSQKISADNKADPLKPALKFDAKEFQKLVKVPFDKKKAKELISALDNDSFKVRAAASLKLLKIPDYLSLEELSEFSIYITNEIAKSNSLEVSFRLKQVEKKVVGILKFDEMRFPTEKGLRETLYNLAKSENPIRSNPEVIKPLIQSYLDFTKQKDLKTTEKYTQAYLEYVKRKKLDSKILEKNLQALIDFQYFFHFYLNYQQQELLHYDLLTLFDTITGQINNLKDKGDRTSLRIKVLTTMPIVDSYPPDDVVKQFGGEWMLRKKESEKITRLKLENYLPRLSSFFCKEENYTNTEEFVKLTDSLLNSSHSEHPGKHLSPEMMLQFIETNTKYFEKNIQHIIKTYKESNNPDVKFTLSKQLLELYSSFHHLFRERHKAAGSGYLTQHSLSTRVVNTSLSTSTNLKYRPDWCEQISRIERWFIERLERPIREIIMPKEKEPAKAGS